MKPRFRLPNARERRQLQAEFAEVIAKARTGSQRLSIAWQLTLAWCNKLGLTEEDIQMRRDIVRVTRRRPTRAAGAAAIRPGPTRP